MVDDRDPAAYKLVFEERDGYFFVGLRADSLSPAQIESYQQEIGKEISKRKPDRVLICYLGPLPATEVQLPAVVYKVNFWKLQDIKYALVDMAAKNIAEYKFAILYAISRGIDIEIFNSQRVAEQWLLA